MCAKRNLPSWMSACDSGRRREDPSSSSRNRPETSAKKSARKQPPGRIMMYWMNERELMETALGVLKNDVKEEQEDSGGQDHHRAEQTDAACVVAVPEVSVVSETDSEEEPDKDAQEQTCLDVDVAEQETVPYITCTEKERSSRRSNNAGDHHPTHSQAQPELEDNCHRTDPDPEGLELIREIFFS